MPKLTTHKQDKPIKMLFIGDSGSGKTGALASLVRAGFNLVIQDFDNGLDYLVNELMQDKNSDELLARVTYATLTDKMKAVAGQAMIDGVPKAFPNAMNLLTKWKTDTEDLGNISTWGRDTIFVLDSLTLASLAAFRWVQMTKQYKNPMQTYGDAQNLIENTLALLFSDNVTCHVIVNSHITFVDMESGLTKGYPSSVGKALGPKIPRYFNTCLEAKTKGSGAASKHVILTRPDGMIELKSSLPASQLPAELPLETGLAEFFKLAGALPPT